MPRGDILNEADEARTLVAALVGGCDAVRQEAALTTAARAVGLSKWSLWGIYHGKRKIIGAGTLSALRREYLKLCQRQLARLEAEVRELKRRCGDDSVTHLGAAVARVAEKVRKARAAYE